MKIRQYVTPVILLFAVFGFIIYSVLAGANARREGDFSGMIHGLLESDNLVMFVLNTPLSTGETILTTDEAIIQVGDDYVCFGETWNDGIRQRCTPFDNIASVTFVESTP